MEKIAYKPLRKAPRLSALISAIGMSLFLQNYVLLAQTSDFLPFPNLIPDFEFMEPMLTSSVRSGAGDLDHHRHRHGPADFSDQVHQDRQGHAGHGPGPRHGHAGGRDVNRVISVTFIIGSATAAIGGVLIASHIGQINYYIGFIAGIKAFVAAVLGGIGSMPGAVLGSLVLGWTESFFTGYISSDYEDVFAFLFSGPDSHLPSFRPAGPQGHGQGTALIYVVVALGLNIVVGLAGLLDLGYVAFLQWEPTAMRF
jgi:branched-chain amino acid transport system permease protein